MKIAALLWDNIFKTGGREVFTINLVTRLAKRGHSVTLYVPEREKRKRSPLYNLLPFEVRYFPYWQRYAWSHCPRLLQLWLKREQKKHAYDLWQGMGAYPESYLLAAVSAPCAVRMYGEDVQIHEGLNYGARRNPIIRDRVRQGFSNMTGIIAMTPSLAQDALNAGAKREAVHIVPNAIDFKRLQSGHGDKFRRDYGLDKDTVVLLTVGRNHAKKGFDLIPEIGSRLSTDKWKWFIIGSGTDDLLAEIGARGLDGRIIPLQNMASSEEDLKEGSLAVPPQPLIDAFAGGDVFVLPWRIEGYSRVIAEAMGAGLPVITTDAPGCGEIFTHGVEGLVSPVDDVASMAADIDSLVKDADLRNTLSANAVSMAEELDWDRIVDAYLNTYAELQG